MLHRTRFLAVFLALLLASLVAPTTCAVEPPPAHRLVPLGPMAGNVEVLYGDPWSPGQPFVMRIRELAGGVIPPHRHPVDEHITVVEGTLWFGVGDDADMSTATKLETGSYAFIPAGSTMFGYTPEAAVVQVHGVGPFHIHWKAGDGWTDDLTTLDTPGADDAFAFRRGERVTTPRGAGRIRQGFATGQYVGYEIEGDHGVLFMALEGEMERSAAPED